METRRVLLCACVVLALAISVAEHDEVVELGAAPTQMSAGDCGATLNSCKAELSQHTKFHAQNTQKMASCSTSHKQKVAVMEAYTKTFSADHASMQELEGRAASLAHAATAKMAEDNGMDLQDGDFGEAFAGKDGTKHLSDMKAKGLPGIKDALQKAEAVLTYNELQADRLFKKADKMASDPKLLTTKKGMTSVKEAARAAAQASSAKFIAEVQVTKMKAAMQAAEKITDDSKSATKAAKKAAKKAAAGGHELGESMDVSKQLGDTMGAKAEEKDYERGLEKSRLDKVKLIRKLNREEEQARAQKLEAQRKLAEATTEAKLAAVDREDKKVRKLQKEDLKMGEKLNDKMFPDVPDVPDTA